LKSLANLLTYMGHNYKELKIWQKGIDLVDSCYDFTSSLPREEKYNLVSQMTRCACSIPSNIAEGCAKRTASHFAEYLSHSLGSCFELETQVIICERRNFGIIEQRQQLTERINEIKNMIYNFREKIISADRS
jgi:four helix bundle protein